VKNQIKPTSAPAVAACVLSTGLARPGRDSFPEREVRERQVELLRRSRGARTHQKSRLLPAAATHRRKRPNNDWHKSKLVWRMNEVKGRQGGRRPGAGRPRKHPLIVASSPETLRALAEIREALKVQDTRLAHLIQQRREAVEHVPMILRRLTELERVICGGDMHVPVRHTRRRPLGVDT